MSKNISAFGVGAYLGASNTLPIGMFIQAFADDDDAIKFSTSNVSGAQMDLNGKMVSWSSAHPISLSIAVIPHSTADNLLSVLLAANRPAAFTTEANDVITLVVKYPDFTIRTFTDGRVISGPSGAGFQSVGRLTTNSYSFSFGDMTTINVATAINSLFRDTGISSVIPKIF